MSPPTACCWAAAGAMSKPGWASSISPATPPPNCCTCWAKAAWASGVMATSGGRTRNQLGSLCNVAITLLRAGISEWGLSKSRMVSTRCASCAVLEAVGSSTMRCTMRGKKLASPLMAPVLPIGPMVGRSGSKPTYTVSGGMKACPKATECARSQLLSLMPAMMPG